MWRQLSWWVLRRWPGCQKSCVSDDATLFVLLLKEIIGQEWISNYISSFQLSITLSLWFMTGPVTCIFFVLSLKNNLSMLFLNGHCKKVCAFEKINVFYWASTHADSRELCHAQLSVTSQSIFQWSREGVSPAELEGHTWCEGIDRERSTFLFFPYPTPHHPLCTLLLLFCKHCHCSQSKLSFQVDFPVSFALALSGGEGEVMKTPDTAACGLTAETKGWTQHCSALVPLGAPKVGMISPLTPAQRFGDGTPSVLELQLISFTSSFCCSLSWQLERVLIKGLTHFLSQLIIFFWLGARFQDIGSAAASSKWRGDYNLSELFAAGSDYQLSKLVFIKSLRRKKIPVFWDTC